jgi:stearoyl-CoA desaturase (delta-9 desaturase)
MSRAHRYTNLGGVFLPLIAILVAIVQLWNTWVDWIDIGLLLGFYAVTALGITIGYHRMLTHRALQGRKPVEYLFAVAGSMAVQGSVITWVADHRKHHAFTDLEGDPHSPHVGEGQGWRGFVHAHVGWMFTEHGRAARRKYAGDLLDDRGMVAIDRAFPWLTLATVALPAVFGFVLHGFTATGALQGLIWGAGVRIFLLHHVTWSINSICHMFGTQRFDIDDESRNVFWLALPSLGEAWHHNHHAFPRSAEHGLKWYEVDVSGLVIRGLEKLRLVRNVVRITPERQAEKLRGA